MVEVDGGVHQFRTSVRGTMMICFRLTTYEGIRDEESGLAGTVESQTCPNCALSSALFRRVEVPLAHR